LKARCPELGLVWTLFAVVTVEVFVTYARSPVSQLYHVTGSGFEAGASRALVFLNFPVALVAIAAIGVALAFGLTVWTLGSGLVGRLERRRGDYVRIALAVALAALGLPWMAADLGFSCDGVPVLGSIYLTGELRTQPGDPVFHHAVHHGHHHGMDGVLLVATALLLSRLVPAIRARFLRGLAGAYLALLACYGAGNIANDFWLEQVVKRGWTLWEVPDVTTPKASTAWAIIVIAAIVLWVAFVLPLVRHPDAQAARSTTATP